MPGSGSVRTGAAIHHKGVFELAIHRLLDVVEVLVFRQFVKLTTQVIFPVRPFSIFAIRSPVISERGRANRLRFAAFRRGMQVLIVKIERARNNRRSPADAG